MVDMVEFIMLEISSCERMLKSSSSASVVAVASFSLWLRRRMSRNLILSRLRSFLGNGRAYDSAQIGLCQDSLHHGGVWGQHEVVLVHTHGVVSLLLEHTYHTERDAVESHHLADRVAAVGKEIIYHGLSQDADLGSCLDVGIGKHFSICHLQLSDARGSPGSRHRWNSGYCCCRRSTVR